MEEMQSVTFTNEDGETIECYVLEQTMLGGINYILVTDSEEDEEATAFIMKENAKQENDEYAVYDIVDDGAELQAVAKVFAELMEDVSIEL